TYHRRLGSDPEKVIVEKFTYDSQNRLLTHTHQVGNNPVEYLAQNKYNEISQLESKKVGGTAAASPLQTVDYKYNIRGWMTRINDPANLNGKLFGYEMKYNNPVYTNTSSGSFNGNITEIDWNIFSAEGLKRYNYQYDPLNRMLKGVYSEPNSSVAQNNYFNEELTYDLNGNIKTLKRFSWPVSGGTTAEKIDDLIYNYQNGDKSNTLDRITLPPGVINNSSGYNALQGTMGYNLNGNMTDHPDKKMKISYNYLNLPSYISVNEGLIGISNTSYTYRADGTKVSKTYSMNGSIETNYLDGFQYDNRHAYDTSASLYTVPSLKFVPTSEGYYDFTENKYIYNYTDHLGNIRVSYKNNGTAVEVIDTNSYYPFGLKHQNGPVVPAPFAGVPYNYKYNGKELQETGMYDYGARFYMPDMGRWGVVDPLAEKMRRWSPYNYAFNNPLRYIDPDGRQGTDIYELNKKGELIWRAASERDVIYASKNFDKNSNLNANNDGGVDVGEKGYIKNNSQEKTLSSPITDNEGNSSDKLSTLSFHNNESKASEVAEYFYNNTNVETANSTYKSSTSDSNFSVISTYHLPSTSPLDPKGTGLMSNFSVGGDNFFQSSLTAQDHNHPLGYQLSPSGFNYGAKGFKVNTFDCNGKNCDVNVAKAHDNIKLRVYSTVLKKYIRYDGSSANIE
ncbi:RHS repeat domain-containing protein, partial [Chryseobacterium sp. ON_d1]|uniref:RHS repeat domain-containing protein n=1 Tax=Chryseobacterium sp. ON_d1 TaxID=2583211 RepID=UPI001159AD25